jgi:transcriptional regulator with XRE-family HTH domain
MNREELTSLVARAVSDARVNMKELSEEAGVSYDTVRSWASGRRSPRPEGVVALADALERRSERLADLAHELRDAVTER